MEAGIELKDAEKIPLGTIFALVHPARGDLGQGYVIASVKNKITLRVATDVPIRLGDIACPIHA